MHSATLALVALGRRLAATAGALTALVSLLRHVPVHVACLRGAAAFALVGLVTWVGRSALERSLRADRVRAGGGVRP